eukprot:GHVS01078843.1.p1 GENE.GHVS01078843.1~~GHVS01078843.1.p1  ORF type:complete len:411 (+),score=60.11 GHVS01078843.1:114-1346(+)
MSLFGNAQSQAMQLGGTSFGFGGASAGSTGGLFGGTTGGLFGSTTSASAPAGGSLFAPSTGGLGTAQPTSSFGLFGSAATTLNTASLPQPSASILCGPTSSSFGAPSQGQSLFGGNMAAATTQPIGLTNPGAATVGATGSSMSTETQYYLTNVDRRIRTIEAGDQRTAFIYFTLSSPEQRTGLVPQAGMGQSSAAQANAMLEREVLQASDAMLLARFQQTKSENPDMTSIYIIPIKGFAELKQRNISLKADMAVLDSQAERLASLAKANKARIRTTSQQVKRIKEMSKTLRFQLIRMTKLLEDNARMNGNFEVNPAVSRENEVLFRTFESKFRIGNLYSELKLFQGLVQTLKEAKANANGSYNNCDALDEAANVAISKILLQQKKTFQAFYETFSKAELAVAAMESSLKT